MAFQGLDKCAKQIESGRQEFQKCLSDNVLFAEEELRAEMDFHEENDSDSESGSSCESNHEYDDEEGNETLCKPEHI